MTRPHNTPDGRLGTFRIPHHIDEWIDESRGRADRQDVVVAALTLAMECRAAWREALETLVTERAQEKLQ
jgi:hypothetical protein